MNAQFYELANQLAANSSQDADTSSKRLSDEEIKTFTDTVLTRIHAGEKQNTMAQHAKYTKKRRRAHRVMKYTAAAACTALLLCATVFSEDVHAAIEHINWSLSNALGLPEDLDNYRSVINTTATDNGYVITLQEVVAADEKLVVNYTIQREDGKSMGEIPASIFERLYINGKRQFGGVSGGSGFLDDAHTVVGVSHAFDVDGINMAKENTYRLHVDSLEENMETDVKGNWLFSFSADGSELIADTVRIPIGKDFTLEGGATITLDELTSNKLEQRIIYHIDGESNHIFRIDAIDNTGKHVEFDTKIFDSASGHGYMQNQEIMFDGRINPTAVTVTITLSGMELPEESGRMSDDYKQIGESIELNIN